VCFAKVSFLSISIPKYLIVVDQGIGQLFSFKSRLGKNLRARLLVKNIVFDLLSLILILHRE